jgi:hypothetical protein
LQHYGNIKRPVWIKAYAHLLDDGEDHALPIPTRLLWRQLLLLAARHGNAIPNVPKRIADDTHLPLRVVREGLPILLETGWLRETKTDRRSIAGSRRKTGWRFKRGTHSGHYVPDPDGVDTPPYAARNETTRRVA